MENTKSKDFNEFIKDIIERLKEVQENEGDDVLFIFDNARIHISSETKSLFQENHVCAFTLPPYCP